MPRINIEEKWWSDPRRMMLTIKLGYGTADGAFFNAVKLSQEHNGEPFEATCKLPLDWIEALLSVGLATGSKDDFYVKGSKEHHEWIKSQRERAVIGGRKSAQLRQATAKQTLDHTQANAQPSSSSSISNKKNIYIKGSELWTLFSSQYQEKKGKQPTASAPAMKTASEIESVLPKDEWASVIEAYLSDTNPFLYKQGFQIVWLLRNLDKYRRIAPTKDPMISYFDQVAKEKGWSNEHS